MERSFEINPNQFLSEKQNQMCELLYTLETRMPILSPTRSRTIRETGKVDLLFVSIFICQRGFVETESKHNL